MAQPGASASIISIRHILITGAPGTGKTTLIQRLYQLIHQQLPQIPCYGFYTEEVRGNTRSRIGFDVVTLDGKLRTPLARINEYTNSISSSLPRVGQYNVFIDDFEHIVIPLLTNIQRPCICFIDEIGKMELFSRKFQQSIQNLFDQLNIILIATIPIKSLPFVDRIRTRNDCHLVTITRENRSDSKLQDELMIQLNKLTQMIV